MVPLELAKQKQRCFPVVVSLLETTDKAKGLGRLTEEQESLRSLVQRSSDGHSGAKRYAVVAMVSNARMPLGFSG